MGKYFAVSGQRTVWERTDCNALPVFSGWDPSTQIARYQRVGITRDAFLRFESLDQSAAEQYATDVYSREGIICAIDEISL